MARPPLAGRTAVVTGASSGIGRAIAVAFAQAGARVGLGFWASGAKARALAAQLGAPHELLRANLSTLEGCEAIVENAVAALGELDVWVNNAGADILTGESSRWPVERKLEALVELDLKGTIRCSRLVGPRLRAGGCIINIGWDHATLDGMAGEEAQLFAAVKAGVLGFSKSLARSLAPDVRVNVLCPGWIQTAYGHSAPGELHARVRGCTPLGRWGTPEDVAGAAVWLASPQAAFVTGQAINLNGGAVG